jgi:hypothetical protein
MKRAVIFTHHEDKPITRERLEKVKRLNPEWDVFPAGFKGYALIEGSHEAVKDGFPSNKKLAEYTGFKEDWLDPDLIFYDFYRNHPNYDGYFVYEYDTICNVPIEKFFDTNFPFVGNDIRDPASPKWHWDIMYRKLNPLHTYFPKLRSYGISSCLYFSKRIMEKCVEELTANKKFYDCMISEARGGTIINMYTELRRAKPDINKYIGWRLQDIDPDLSREEYFYHPIK